jgi:hypothetical protein
MFKVLGRPRRRWEDNIKMDVEEVGGGRGDWMEKLNMDVIGLAETTGCTRIKMT